MDHRDTGVTPEDKKQPKEPTAAELQARLHTTRESITQTVAEMKSTMNNQYQQAKDRATQSLDWKIQMRKYPIAACVGALAVGYLAGRSLGHAGDSDHDDLHEGRTDFTNMHGSSLAPSTSSRSHSVVSPETRSRVANRVEGVLSNLAEHFLSELTRVGKEVLVPTVMTALTTKLHEVAPSSTQFDTSQQNAGGTGTFGSSQENRGPSYQGRSI